MGIKRISPTTNAGPRPGTSRHSGPLSEEEAREVLNEQMWDLWETPPSYRERRWLISLRAERERAEREKRDRHQAEAMFAVWRSENAAELEKAEADPRTARGLLVRDLLDDLYASEAARAALRLSLAQVRDALKELRQTDGTYALGLPLLEYVTHEIKSVDAALAKDKKTA